MRWLGVTPLLVPLYQKVRDGFVRVRPAIRGSGLFDGVCS